MLSELPDEANKLAIILANRLGNSSQSKLFSITCGYKDCQTNDSVNPVLIGALCGVGGFIFGALSLFIFIKLRRYSK